MTLQGFDRQAAIEHVTYVTYEICMVTGSPCRCRAPECVVQAVLES